MADVYNEIASSDHHDKVRLPAIELVNKYRNMSNSRLAAAGPQGMAMEDICYRLASWNLKAAPKLTIKSNSVSDNSSTNASTAAPIAAPVSSHDVDSMDIDTISSPSTANAPCYVEGSMEVDTISSSNTAPAPSCVGDSMQIDSSSSSRPATAPFSFSNNSAILFPSVDATAMDGNCSSGNVVPVNVNPITSTLVSTSSPTLSSPSLWSNLQADHVAGSRFTTAPSTPILQSTPASSPTSSSPTASSRPISQGNPVSSSTTSAKSKPTLPFGFPTTATGLFSNADTSAIDLSSPSSTPSSSIPNSDAASVSISTISDDEDIVMSGDEVLDEMEFYSQEDEVNVEILRHVQDSAVGSMRKRKRGSARSTQKKRARSASPSIRPPRRLRNLSEVPSTPSSSTTPAKPKPTSFVRSTQFVHKPELKKFKARQVVEKFARCMERFCKVPAEALYRSAVARRG